MDNWPAEGLTPTPYKANILRGLGSPHRRPSLRGAGCPAPFPGWSPGPVKCSEVGAAILQTGAFTDRPAVSRPLLLSVPVTQHLPRDTHRNSSCFGRAHRVHPSSPSHWLFVLQSLSNSWSPNDAPPPPAPPPPAPLPHRPQTRRPPSSRPPLMVLWGCLTSRHHLSSSLFQS